jgi:hypothetical protein
MALFSKNGFREATQKNVTLEILAEGMPSNVFCLVSQIAWLASMFVSPS